MSDGRAICTECRKSAIVAPRHIVHMALEVRQFLKEKLDIYTDHQIAYAIVDVQELKGMTGHSRQGTELGLFSYRVTMDGGRTVYEEYTIYLAYGIPEDRLREVIAHELAHDWMRAVYPHIRDLRIIEGWAEYVASRVNEEYGKAYLNKRMENNPDPIYGDGYRLIKRIAENQGVKGLEALFSRKNAEGAESDGRGTQ